MNLTKYKRLEKLNYLSTLILLLVLSCSGPESAIFDSCERTNWYGTYDKISEECDNGGSPLFENIATWKEGPCDNCISDMSTTEYRINEECKLVHITPLGWEIITELDEDIMIVNISTLNCMATYERRK